MPRKRKEGTDLQPSRGADQFPLRLPDGMRQRIKQAADKIGRSMNAEIIGRLDNYDLLLLDKTDAENRIQLLESALAAATVERDALRKELHEADDESKAESAAWLDALRSIEKRLRESTAEHQRWRAAFGRSQDVFQQLLVAIRDGQQDEVLRIYGRWKHFIGEFSRPTANETEIDGDANVSS